MTRALRFIVHNWPLKLGAIALSTLLYGGLVLSQTTRDFPGSIPIEPVNGARDVTVLSQLGSVSRIRYVAPQDLGLRIDDSSFKATVDLAGVDPTGGPVPLTVRVTAVDPRVQVLDFEPRRIVVTIDRVAERTLPIHAVLGTIPQGFEVGDPVLDVTEAKVTGPDTVVRRATEVQARIVIDPSGIDVNTMVPLVPVDGNGQELTPVDVAPSTVHVKVPVFTDRRTRTLPVSPVIVGTPAAGFEVESVTVDPLTVSVAGDANDLSNLDRVDTAPVSVSGASSQVVQTVALALPDGVQALGTGSVRVTVSLRPVTATRTFAAGLVLVGADPAKHYELSTDRVLVTIGGSVADLDRLSGATLVLSVDVTGLQDGTHAVPVSANLNTGLTLVGASPNPIDVRVTTVAASAAPSTSPAPSP